MRTRSTPSGRREWRTGRSTRPARPSRSAGDLPAHDEGEPGAPELAREQAGERGHDRDAEVVGQSAGLATVARAVHHDAGRVGAALRVADGRDRVPVRVEYARLGAGRAVLPVAVEDEYAC